MDNTIDHSKDYLKRVDTMGEPARNIDRLLTSLKMGEAYWQRGYIDNMQRRLLKLRTQKTQWVGYLENKLRIDVDNYIRNTQVFYRSDS